MKWPLLLLAALTSGCGTLTKPPLPKFAIGEAPQPPPQDEQWAANIRRADVIYLGLTEKNETQGESVQRIVDALRKDGGRVALGWTEFPAAQQPLLDQWQRREISAQQLLAQLDAPRYGDWMQPAVRPDLTHVALGAPRPLLRKIRAGDSLTSEERALLPTDYRPSPEAFDNFVERISTSSRLRRFDVTRLYRAHLAAEQIIAHNVVLFTRSNPKVKLLVFLPNDAMIDPREVADYASQKASLQQLILDRSESRPNERPQLLAHSAGRSLQIIDRAPGPGGNDRRLSPPRLRT